MALTSCSRLISSFDWQTALPHGQSILPPSILVMSASRQVLMMSQETSSPCGFLVARISQSLTLQALRACFSANSSGLISGLFASGAGVGVSAGLAGGLVFSAKAERFRPTAMQVATKAVREKSMESSSLRPYPKGGGVWSAAGDLSRRGGRGYL